jgi:hypothetical protein
MTESVTGEVAPETTIRPTDIADAVRLRLRRLRIA